MCGLCGDAKDRAWIGLGALVTWGERVGPRGGRVLARRRGRRTSLGAEFGSESPGRRR